MKSNNNNNFKSLTSVKFSIIYIIIQEVLNITHFTLKVRQSIYNKTNDVASVLRYVNEPGHLTKGAQIHLIL